MTAKKTTVKSAAQKNVAKSITKAEKDAVKLAKQRIKEDNEVVKAADIVPAELSALSDAMIGNTNENAAVFIAEQNECMKSIFLIGNEKAQEAIDFSSNSAKIHATLKLYMDQIIADKLANVTDQNRLDRPKNQILTTFSVLLQHGRAQNLKNAAEKVGISEADFLATAKKSQIRTINAMSNCAGYDLIYRFVKDVMNQKATEAGLKKTLVVNKKAESEKGRFELCLVEQPVTLSKAQKAEAQRLQQIAATERLNAQKKIDAQVVADKAEAAEKAAAANKLALANLDATLKTATEGGDQKAIEAAQTAIDDITATIEKEQADPAPAPAPTGNGNGAKNTTTVDQTIDQQAFTMINSMTETEQKLLFENILKCNAMRKAFDLAAVVVRNSQCEQLIGEKREQQNVLDHYLGLADQTDSNTQAQITQLTASIGEINLALDHEIEANTALITEQADSVINIAALH